MGQQKQAQCICRASDILDVKLRHNKRYGVTVSDAIVCRFTGTMVIDAYWNSIDDNIIDQFSRQVLVVSYNAIL